MRSLKIIVLFCIAVALGENVNIKLVPDQFVFKARQVPDAVIEYKSPTQEFKKKILEASEKYIAQLVQSLLDQAEHQACTLITDVQKISKDFDRSINNIKTDSPADFLDNGLKNVTKQLKVFLTQLPGDVKIKRRALPELPIQQSTITSMPEMRSSKDLFLNLAEIINGDLTSMHGFMNALFLAGWENSRLSLNILQEQFRDGILNGSIMEAYMKAVSKVHNESNLVQEYVESETWKEFIDVSNRIITISNDFQKSHAV